MVKLTTYPILDKIIDKDQSIVVMNSVNPTTVVAFYPELTLARRSMRGEASGVMDTGVRRTSIMVITVSGTLVASLHFSSQLGSFSVSISLACARKHRV